MLSFASILSALTNIVSTIVNILNRAKLVQIGKNEQRLKELENEKVMEQKAEDVSNTSDDMYLARVRNKYERESDE